jgi:S-formylglutathione hydrolase FrmB
VSRAAPRAAASRLDTTTFWSQSLGARKRVVTWLPPSYDHAPTRRYPLAIYLHGIWGNETNWTERGAIHHTLDSLVAAGMPEFIVAMPDGDDGWYTTWNVLGDYGGCRRDFQPRNGDTADTYCVPWLHYDDYIARDLVEYLDRAYRTDPRRERRGIAGLSMGGYGAISIALAYPEVFRAAASHSGVLSPLLVGPDPFAPPPAYATTIEQLERAWGDRFWPLIRPAFGPDTTAWWSRDPARRAAQLWSTDRRLVPALMLDIGTEDGLLGQNRAFRHELARLGVPHTYAEWPGKHEWPYWRQHAAESLRFLAGHIAR